MTKTTTTITTTITTTLMGFDTIEINLVQTNFCVETVRSCLSFWVPWKLYYEQKKYDKIWPFTWKIAQKTIWQINLSWRCKMGIHFNICEPKEVKSAEIFYSPKSLLHSVIIQSLKGKSFKKMPLSPLINTW